MDNLDNSTISENKATINSIGMFSDSSGNILSGTKFIHNNITDDQRYLVLSKFNSDGAALKLFQSDVKLSGITMVDNFSPNSKNIQIMLSNITISSSNFIDSIDLYSLSIYSSQYGGYINSLLSTIKIFNSSFQNGVANNGGAIYSLKSDLEVSSSTFINNTAVISGGAIYSQSDILLSITSSNFTSNFAVTGGSFQVLYSAALNNIISNWIFTAGLNPMFIHLLSSTMEISNWSFGQSSQYNLGSLTETQLIKLENGTAIALEGPTYFNLHECSFNNILALQGILMLSQPDSTNNQTLTNSKYSLSKWYLKFI